MDESLLASANNFSVGVQLAYDDRVRARTKPRPESDGERPVGPNAGPNDTRRAPRRPCAAVDREGDGRRVSATGLAPDDGPGVDDERAVLKCQAGPALVGLVPAITQNNDGRNDDESDGDEDYERPDGYAPGPGAQWQVSLPESVKLLPACGRNSHS